MKTKIIRRTSNFFIALIFLIINISVYGQLQIEVKNNNAQMSKGNQPCYTVQVPQTDLKTVQQAWIKELQNGNKAKVKEISQELVMLGAVKPEITSDSINIYSLLIPGDSLVTLHAFFEIKGAFFGPDADKTLLATDKIDNNIKLYMRTFAVELYRKAVEDELENQEKALKTMESDLDKLEKNEDNLTKEISNLENEIEEKEREVKELDAQIDLKNQEINTHSTSMLSITTETDKKAAEEKKKALEKEKKELEKDRSKAKDKISSDKSKIKENEKGIEDSKELQSSKQNEIIDQTNVVNKVQAKLNGIK